MEERLVSLFGRVERESFFRELAPELTIGDGTLKADRYRADEETVARARRDLEEHGYLQLEGLVPAPRVSLLAGAIERLGDQGVPASFVFAYDEAWSVALGALHALGPVIGDDYGAVPDVWAWLVPRASGARGWKAHRGTYEDNRRNGAPRIINVWIALSDVTIESACMHVVPLDRDPHVPLDLRNLAYDERDVVALPARAGTLQAWSSNVLHWGGEMTQAAESPRISMSVTLRAPADTRDLREASVLPFRQRLDLVAEMIAIYGDNEGEALDPARVWAKMTLAMKQLGHR